MSPSLHYNDHIDSLKSLGAEASGHVKDSLLSHLEGTHALLKEWGNRDELCLAGLYHAVYSTHGFTQSLLDPGNRDSLKDLIGIEAENIVYCFCACDREQFYPQIGIREHPVLHNRFTDEEIKLEPPFLRDLIELTVANELQIIRDKPHQQANKTLKSRAGALLRALKAVPQRETATSGDSRFKELFNRCTPYMSQPALRCFHETFSLPHEISQP